MDFAEPCRKLPPKDRAEAESIAIEPDLLPAHINIPGDSQKAVDENGAAAEGRSVDGEVQGV
jgi:hypothetical protein